MMRGAKIFIVTGASASAITAFMQKHSSELNSYNYKKTKELFEQDLYNYFAFGWEKALKRRGYIVESAQYNVSVIQEKWANENLGHSAPYSSFDILKEQIRTFKPDILWYDWVGYQELHELRHEFPSISLFVGWVGSALASNGQWRELDMVFSCAPESVSVLREQGVAAEHLNHAFDPDILKVLPRTTTHNNIIFIGSLIQGKGFHNQRRALLHKLAAELPILIYAPSVSAKDTVKSFIKKGLYFLSKPILNKKALPANKICDRLSSWKDAKIQFPESAYFGRHLRSPVFGVEMFQALQQASAALNIHADSSPFYASNMRLYETTGVGTCLLTEGKGNLGELFEENREVVPYSSDEDCMEKAKWLIAHPEKCELIAKAGQARCLRDHTYDRRVDEWEYLLGKYL
ncbi:MAG: glycosyltransferase family 1 protein [Schwartzia succinivorans]|nr:glycosyltransferase family 1 protein [Schwartzia succinivorans]